MKEGMDGLLAVESSMEWQKLPAGFWDDYIFCAQVSDMPAHILRAIDHLAKLKAPPFAFRNVMIEIAQKRFKTPDLAATYPFNAVWARENTTAGQTFLNPMFGLSVWLNSNWKGGFFDVTQGFILLQVEAGPHKGKAGNVSPGLVVMVRQPKPGETLNDFMLHAWPHGPEVKPADVMACPAQTCLAGEAVRPGAYQAAGDGHFFFTAFQRDEPEFPGLMFETSQQLLDTKKPGLQHFEPKDRWHRLPGTLYYLVVLDTAESVLPDAK